MRFPLSMTAAIAAYVFKNKRHPKPEWQEDVPHAEGESNPFRVIRETGVNGNHSVHPMLHRRFPLVLMLEPLHACNLSCAGCGRIREYQSTIKEKLTVEQCVHAIDECGAPVVSICGGEPLVYSEIGRLVRETLARRKYIYLCTNGVFLRKRLGEFTPNGHFFFNVHLDGMEETHDRCVERKGVFREAIEGIKAAKAAGFKVSTNTTVYKETDMKEIEVLFAYLEQFNVDGHMIAPGFDYSSVDDQGLFMTRDDVYAKFKDIERLARRFRLNTTPVYLDFLQGKRELPCTAWGNPTYNIRGWRSPCYLISDRHYDTFEEFMTKTAWKDYGSGNDTRCTHCMMHCGYEPSAALGINGKASDNLRLLTWVLR